MSSEEPVELWPGIIICTTIAVISFAASIMYNLISSLMWAFIYSILITNFVSIPKRFLPGITFCSRDFLRGVIALGIVTSAFVWLEIGIGVINALIVIFLSYFLVYGLEKKRV
ncbi:putative sulfate exporter family transporter [Candidatus Bathyarchaeota archaeon]|nr:putative sulfate exporter family transporter [Candidatus Bathyarchaeota archaeon]